ncbi:MAG: CAP domain-containing protein [Patescibacteria group bacterium]
MKSNKSFKIFLIIWTALFVIVIGTLALHDYQRMKRSSDTKVIGVEIFNQINQVRKEQGLPILKYNRLLSRAGQDHCEDMIKYDYFDHDREGRNMVDFVSELGISGGVGENIARDINEPKEIVNRWMESESHKEIMLGDFKEVGVGICKQDGGDLLVSSYYIKK